MEQYTQIFMNPAVCRILTYPPKNSFGSSYLLYDAVATLPHSLTNHGQISETTNQIDPILKKAEERSGSPSTSSDGEEDGSRYAGPKFSHAPLPENLPKPPTHWTAMKVNGKKAGKTASGSLNHANGKYANPEETVNVKDLTSHLKQLLKVQ